MVRDTLTGLESDSSEGRSPGGPLKLLIYPRTHISHMVFPVVSHP